jgi:sugar O-acyltransferase (sialic acid O-acetyltransferase NeuD family)
MSDKEKIILVGAGGHCKSVIDVIEQEGKFAIAGIIDVKEKLNTMQSGYKVIATDEQLPDLVKEVGNFCVTIGQIESGEARLRIYETLKSLGAQLPVIISPKAYVSPRTKLGDGTVVMHGAVVNAGASLGANTIVNSLALVEHDAKVGDHCHVSTHAVINGEVIIGNHVFVGSSAVIINNVSVGNRIVIGAGAVVHKSISEKGTYAGNPAKRIRE